jgi:AraC-like DNA-binding protein
MLIEHTLFHGTLVEVSDVRCRVRSAHCGAEEYATGHWLVLPRSGAFVKHSGARTIIADAAHAIFFNAGESYRVSHPAGLADACTTVVFSTTVLREVAVSVGAREPSADRAFHLTHAMLSPRSMLLHHWLQRRCSLMPDARLAIEEDSMTLLEHVFRDAGHQQQHRSATRDRTARVRRDLVEATRLELLASPGHARSLAELAQAVATSPFHLTRVFRRELGLPVHQYLVRLRLGLALERLMNGDESLSRIAFDLGFASHSHFSAAFRRVYGASPTQVARGSRR